MLKQARIKYLISIGGEGSLFLAHWIEKEARGTVNVVHVPKTIDNDVPMPGGLATFGYQTARHIGVHIVQNLMEDARTMGRWYLVTTMGRNAGHLALGMGVASGATVTLIPEEFEGKVTLAKVADVLAGSIIKRLAMGRNHGVAILAEGIADRLNAEDLASEQCEKDSMGRVRLSDIPLGRLLRGLVRKTLEKLGINITIVDKNIGYEMRAADPIPYDVEYTRNLGYGAVRFLLKGGTGSMIVVYEGNIRPIPFVEMLEFSDGTVKVRKVDLNSEAYEAARKYMIRLERSDFENPQLDQLAGVTNLKPEEFNERFSHLIDRSTVSYPLTF